MENRNVQNDDKNFKLKAGLFLTGVAGLSALIGFGSTLALVKRQDPKNFDKGIAGTLEMSETGANLAARALGRATVYAFAGCGVLFYAIWKLSGAKNFEEFRHKIGSVLPRLTKHEHEQQGRTEFSGLNDLLDYLQHQKSSKDK